jgi:hypothetical protein
MNIPAAKIYFPEEDRGRILEKISEVLETDQLTLGKYGGQKGGYICGTYLKTKKS